MRRSLRLNDAVPNDDADKSPPPKDLSDDGSISNGQSRAPSTTSSASCDTPDRVVCSQALSNSSGVSVFTASVARADRSRSTDALRKAASRVRQKAADAQVLDDIDRLKQDFDALKRDVRIAMLSLSPSAVARVGPVPVLPVVLDYVKLGTIMPPDATRQLKKRLIAKNYRANVAASKAVLTQRRDCYAAAVDGMRQFLDIVHAAASLGSHRHSCSNCSRSRSRDRSRSRSRSRDRIRDA